MQAVERNNIVTMKGKPLTLIGPEIEITQEAPDCTLIMNDLSEIKLSAFRGKKCLISSVPSLDTPVCELQTKRLNQESAMLGENTVILTISMDLPFAQKRWCGATGSLKIQVLSDHRDASFGQAYGVLIKGLRILARAIFLIDKEGIVQYIQIVNEVTQEPDYEAVLEAVRKL